MPKEEAEEAVNVFANIDLVKPPPPKKVFITSEEQRERRRLAPKATPPPMPRSMASSAMGPATALRTSLSAGSTGSGNATIPEGEGLAEGEGDAKKEDYPPLEAPANSTADM